MQFSENSRATQKISVLLFEAFSNHCLANTIEPFRAANAIARQPLYAWEIFSLDGGTVCSSSGLPIETGSLSAAQPGGDFLFLIPSYHYADYATPRMSRSLRAARTRFKTLVGMDAGSWLLAAAGLLDGRRATIHWDEFRAFSETFPHVDAVEDRFVIEPDLASCGGASTAIELTLELIKRRHSPMFALEVAALFMHGDRLDLHDPIQRLTSDALVRNATALMRRSIETPLPIPDVARRLKVDQKVLEECFRKDMRMTPLAVYKAIRLREARRLVELTRLSIAEIAERCGYRNASAMTRAYRQEFGVAPRGHRGRG
ncbi:GlxA family transcriptional regulator [Roseibium aggregatum]|uniref:Helix-turn-helix domain-containing protein n=1 Tax=Roseibium aggregatum TaxID=187304 RepID=A0A939J315_9HYPH|nr:helix-turn-helix domain-containing protein [Roseibium aggregatum]MBN9673766.1 helix-turn-helix domain-containing protein [Roseibium aggregatum]